MKRANILQKGILGAALTGLLLVATLFNVPLGVSAGPDKVRSAKEQRHGLTLENIAPKQGLHRATPVRTAFSADGKHIAYLIGGNLEVIEVKSKKILPVMDAKVHGELTGGKEFVGVREFTWSPNASELLIGSSGSLFRWKPGDAKPERLTKGNDPEIQARFLPDGKGHTFVRNLACADLLVQRGADGATKTLVEQKIAEAGIYWHQVSPDGRYLAYGASRWTTNKAERKVNIPNFRGRFLTFDMKNRPLAEDGTRPLEAKICRIDLQNGADRKPVVVYTGMVADFGDAIFDPSWSLDSKQIAISAFQGAKSELRILTVDMTAKAPEAKEIHRLEHTGGPDTPMMMAASFVAGDRIAFLAETTGFRQIHVLDPKTSKLAVVTSGEYEVYPVQWSPDRSKVYVASAKENPACQDVYEVTLVSGNMRRITAERGFYDEIAVSNDGAVVVANHVRFGAVKTTVKIDAATGDQSTLLDDQPAQTRKLVEARPGFFNFQNRHGDVIHGYMFKPAQDSGEKRPLLIYVYGGPLGKDKMVKEGNYNEETYFFLRYMTEKHGYVTCVIDPRGTSGYGARFEKANFGQPGRPQVEDLEDAVRHFVDQHGVDAKRVALMGWSFGGFQTQLALYTRPKVFAAGIAVAGPTEWENYYGGYNAKVIETRDLQRFSLVPLAKNLEGRLLLIHGAEDDRVLFQDTVQIHRELQRQGKTRQVELHVDWTGNHFLNNGDLRPLERLKLYEDFLLRSLTRSVENLARAS